MIIIINIKYKFTPAKGALPLVDIAPFLNTEKQLKKDKQGKGKQLKTVINVGKSFTQCLTRWRQLSERFCLTLNKTSLLKFSQKFKVSFQLRFGVMY